MDNQKTKDTTQSMKAREEELANIKFNECEKAIQDAIVREFNQLKTAIAKNIERQQVQLEEPIVLTEEYYDDKHGVGMRIRVNPLLITLILLALLIAGCIIASWVGIIPTYDEIEKSIQSEIQKLIIYLTSFLGTTCPPPVVSYPGVI